MYQKYTPTEKYFKTTVNRVLKNILDNAFSIQEAQTKAKTYGMTSLLLKMRRRPLHYNYIPIGRNI